ncbi:MAG: hypothetical protein KAT68_10120 [Bacteroidales bacterium]|nr:hypothetical protein [Bacteroidales bacterium]
MTFTKNIFILSIVTLITGLIAYFIFWDHWTRYIFAHIGALGIIGLFAYLAGTIAEKKGLNYKKAILLGFFPSILLGIIADYLIDTPRENGLPSSCGGIVSLCVALIVVIIYFIAKQREISK